MEYQTLRLPWPALKELPRREVLLYFACGQIANEMNTFQKLLLRISAHTTEDEAVLAAQSSMAFQVLKVIAGRLHEALNVLKGNLNLLEKEGGYISAMPIEAQEAWVTLRKDFSKRGLLNEIRHKFAFHSDLLTIEAGLEKLEDDDVFIDFHTKETGNSLFHSGDQASLAALMVLAGASTIKAAYGEASKQASTATYLVVTVCWGYIQAFLQKRFPEKLHALHPDGEIDFIQPLNSPLSFFTSEMR